MRFTILGGHGFVGRNLARYLTLQGAKVIVPARDDLPEPGRDLGHLIYAIGMTGNFRSRPLETVEAHVEVLARWIGNGRFDSLLYLSSARVYGGLPSDSLATEGTPLPMLPTRDSVYDLSKLLGEALCLGIDNPAIRVARLSNVYGPGMSSSLFLGSILGEICRVGHVTIGEAPESSKDYINVEDAVPLLVDIARGGRQRVYNLASGRRVTHRDIADALNRLPGKSVGFRPGGTTRIFPQIDISRIRSEFDPTFRLVTDDIEALCLAFSQN